jgi:serine protease Do
MYGSGAKKVPIPRELFRHSRLEPSATVNRYSGMDERSPWEPSKAEEPSRPAWLDAPPPPSPPPIDEHGEPPTGEIPRRPEGETAEIPTMPVGMVTESGAEAGRRAEPARSSETRGSGWRSALVGGLVGALVAAALSAGIVAAADDDDDGASTATASTSGPADQLSGDPMDIRGVLDKVGPAVVAIEVSGTGGDGAGTGMIIEADGVVLTNAHVVAGAREVTVVLPDGKRVDADFRGSIGDNDVALVQMRGVSGLPTVELGRSSSLQVGDDVVAVGNALGLGAEPTVTSGIVSALDRTIETGGTTYNNLIQTDAAINPGNSGGPLVNVQGQVVGINTAVAGGGAQNIGFALAIDSVRPLVERLQDCTGGGFLGIRSNTVTDASRQQLGIDAEQGAIVAVVESGSAAEDAGLEVGDVITKIDGDDITSASDVGAVISCHSPGDEVTVTYERDGDEQETEVELGTR